MFLSNLNENHEVRILFILSAIKIPDHELKQNIAIRPFCAILPV